MLKSTLRGFTIIELAISIAVLAVVAGIFAPVITQGIDAILITRTKEQLSQEANLAMNWISNDLMNTCSTIDDLPKPGESFYPRIGCWTTTPGLYLTYWRGFPVNPLTLVRRTTDTNVTPNTIVESVITDKLRSIAIRGYRPIGLGALIPSPSSDDAWGTVNEVRFIEIKLSVGDDTNHYDLITRIHPRFIP